MDTNSKLQVLVNRGIRYIFNLPKDSPITVHRLNLKWLKVENRRLYFKLVFLRQLLSSGRPAYLAEKFTEVDDTLRRSLRIHIIQNAPSNTQSELFASSLHIPFASSTTYQKSFEISAARSWNSLPPELRLCESQEIFKRRLHDYLLSQERQEYQRSLTLGIHPG